MPTPGYIWVEGTKLCYIDGSGNKRGQEGGSTSNTGNPGYFWVEGEYIHYIDANSKERVVSREIVNGLGSAGYLWLENTWVHYTRTGGGKTRWHYNVQHANTDGYNDAGQSRSPYTDAGYSEDAHGNCTDIQNCGNLPGGGYDNACWCPDGKFHNDTGYTDSGYTDSGYPDHTNTEHDNTDAYEGPDIIP